MDRRQPIHQDFRIAANGAFATLPNSEDRPTGPRRRWMVDKAPSSPALLAALLFTAIAAESAPAPGDQPAADYDELVIAVGTRGEPRSRVDSAVPVDAFGQEDIESVHSSDLTDMVKTVVPSFSVDRQPISDGASFIRPTHLRGLDSHHALVLLDGKRRHRGAVLRLGAFGPHGVDIGGLPAIAIESVEVLRDGAAAQYGSDAIAGVLNFKLKSAATGFDLRARFGGYGAGDGEEGVLEMNAGFPLGDGGFVNVSAHLAEAAPTSRSEPYDLPIGTSALTPLEATRSRLALDGVTYYGPDAFTYTYAPSGEIVQVLPGSDGVPDDLDTRYADNYLGVGGSSPFNSPVQIWGRPDRAQQMAVVNAAWPVADSATLYGFATYSAKDQSGGFFYRRPGVSQLKPLRLADGSVYDPRTSLYPAGFTPQFRGDVADYALHGGLRGDFRDGLVYDLSATYGNNEIRYFIENTLNPSLGPDTPTRFWPGDLVNDELALNADFAWSPNADASAPLHLAFGMEYRNEGYEIQPGDPTSYAVGPFGRPDPFDFETTEAEVDADPNDAVTTVACRIPRFEAVGRLCPPGDPANNAVPIGSNGFPGFPPAFASDVNRRSRAAYLDMEWDTTPRWLASAALRYERFEDFGQVVIWKAATRYRLTERINLRGSFGTGFRAPTPGQISTTNVSTRIGADGTPRAEGLFPAEHDAARLFGAMPLEAEHSYASTVGLAADFQRVVLTLDHYRIRLEDRITLSSQFLVGAEEAAALAALGVPGASDISQVRFFVNDVETTTQGLDLVVNWALDDFLPGTSLQAAFNYNETEMPDRGRFVGLETKYDIENGKPAMRGVLTARGQRGAFDAMLRLRVFGEYSNAKTANLIDIQHYGREAMLDVEGTWTLRNRHRLKAGAQNLLDNVPDEAAYETCCGMVYRRDSIVPWQGRLYYLQLNMAFD